jgi:hypothetical protein
MEAKGPRVSFVSGETAIGSIYDGDEAEDNEIGPRCHLELD